MSETTHGGSKMAEHWHDEQSCINEPEPSEPSTTARPGAGKPRYLLERRYQILSIGTASMLQILMGKFQPAFDLPEDAVALGVNYAFDRDSFEIRIWSASYAIVPEGSLEPRMPGGLRWRAVGELESIAKDLDAMAKGVG